MDWGAELGVWLKVHQSGCQSGSKFGLRSDGVVALLGCGSHLDRHLAVPWKSFGSQLCLIGCLTDEVWDMFVLTVSQNILHQKWKYR